MGAGGGGQGYDWHTEEGVMKASGGEERDGGVLTMRLSIPPTCGTLRAGRSIRNIENPIIDSRSRSHHMYLQLYSQTRWIYFLQRFSA